MIGGFARLGIVSGAIVDCLLELLLLEDCEDEGRGSRVSMLDGGRVVGAAGVEMADLGRVPYRALSSFIMAVILSN